MRKNAFRKWLIENTNYSNNRCISDVLSRCNRVEKELDIDIDIAIKNKNDIDMLRNKIENELLIKHIQIAPIIAALKKYLQFSRGT